MFYSQTSSLLLQYSPDLWFIFVNRFFISPSQLDLYDLEFTVHSVEASMLDCFIILQYYIIHEGFSQFMSSTSLMPKPTWMYRCVVLNWFNQPSCIRKPPKPPWICIQQPFLIFIAQYLRNEATGKLNSTCVLSISELIHRLFILFQVFFKRKFRIIVCLSYYLVNLKYSAHTNLRLIGVVVAFVLKLLLILQSAQQMVDNRLVRDKVTKPSSLCCLFAFASFCSTLLHCCVSCVSYIIVTTSDTKLAVHNIERDLFIFKSEKSSTNCWYDFRNHIAFHCAQFARIVRILAGILFDIGFGNSRIIVDSFMEIVHVLYVDFFSAILVPILAAKSDFAMDFSSFVIVLLCTFTIVVAVFLSYTVAMVNQIDGEVVVIYSTTRCLLRFCFGLLSGFAPVLLCVPALSAICDSALSVICVSWHSPVIF